MVLHTGTGGSWVNEMFSVHHLYHRITILVYVWISIGLGLWCEINSAQLIILFFLLLAGISAEAQVMLERVLCEHDPHNSASPFHDSTALLLLALPYLTLYLVGY